jgi:Skp family chaperone for outer membrane proteins
MNRKSAVIRILLPAALLLAAAAPGGAQQAATGPKIALIDANRLFTESKLGKSYGAKIDELNQKIRALQQEKEAGAAAQSAELTRLREELQKQDPSMTAADRTEKAQQIRSKERDLQAFVEDGRAEIQSLQQRVQEQAQSLHNEYQSKMRPHIGAVAAEKGIDFLIDAAVTLQLNQTYNITDDVIAHADAAETTGGTKP